MSSDDRPNFWAVKLRFVTGSGTLSLCDKYDTFLASLRTERKGERKEGRKGEGLTESEARTKME